MNRHHNLIKFLYLQLSGGCSMSILNSSQVKCKCSKLTCGTKVCRCKKEGAKCGDHCSCNSTKCKNRENQTPQSTTNDSDDDNVSGLQTFITFQQLTRSRASNSFQKVTSQGTSRFTKPLSLLFFALTQLFKSISITGSHFNYR